MSRTLIAVDRFMALVVGLALIAVGVAGALWWRGTFASWPTRLDTSAAVIMTTQPWWPYAAGLLGLVVILLGLRWLVGHLPGRAISQVTLPGSTPHGRLLAQVRPVTSAAADVLEQTPGVRSASATIQEQRGQFVARLNATIDQQADLSAVAAAADDVASDLARVLQRDDIYCQVNLSVAHRSHSVSRVS
ncbi:MAG: hypothetical protein ABI083_13580 [Lapillicoccus sp.]